MRVRWQLGDQHRQRLHGGLQFNLGTWQSYGGTGLPSNASRETQIAVATSFRDASGGYGPWPGCAAKLGLPR